MQYYIQAVAADPAALTHTFGSRDAGLAYELWNHEDDYIRYLVGNDEWLDGRSRARLRDAMLEFLSGDVSGRVHADYLGKIAHAVIRSAGTPVPTSPFGLREAIALREVLGDPTTLADQSWPIPIGRTKWTLVGVHGVDKCRQILARLDAADDGALDETAAATVREWTQTAIDKEVPLILFWG